MNLLLRKVKRLRAIQKKINIKGSQKSLDKNLGFFCDYFFKIKLLRQIESQNYS